MKLDVKLIGNRNEEADKFFILHGTVFHTYNFLSSIGIDYCCILIFSDGKIVGGLPLVKSSKMGICAYHIPPYAYQFGPVVHGEYVDYYDEIVTCILDNLLKSRQYSFKLFLDQNSVLPFNSKGFTITVGQTHIFSRNELYDSKVLSKDKRRDLRKLLVAKEEGSIYIRENHIDNLAIILSLWRSTAGRVGFAPHLEALKRLLNADIPHYSNVIFDKFGKPLCGAFCPYDSNTMYHLIGANSRSDDKLLARSNILSLYMAVVSANQEGLTFDFEGSNLSGISTFYRSMGGKKKLLYRVQKSTSFYYHILRSVDQWRKENI